MAALATSMEHANSRIAALVHDLGQLQGQAAPAFMAELRVRLSREQGTLGELQERKDALQANPRRSSAAVALEHARNRVNSTSEPYLE